MTVRRNIQYIPDIVAEPMQPLQPGKQQRIGHACVSQPRMIIEMERHESIGSLLGEYFSTSPQTRFIQV